MNADGSEETLRFSVAILSHKRPHLLSRVLWAVSQLDYPAFEIVVVGDQLDISGFGLPRHLASQIKYACCTEANICRSRNLAVELCSGDVIAYCDDDAVPEPDWLSHLARAFAFPDVGGVGGLVRGVDGLREEWAGGIFDRAAVEKPVRMRDRFRVYDADSQVMGDEFIGIMGANSAFRREAILSVGGFDESFRYFLDETDLMLRLAEAGWDCALVLDAEVHHLREENSTRDALRTPRNFVEIAASKAYFCRRHMREGNVAETLAAFRTEREAELDPYIRLGLLRAADRTKLLNQIREGIEAGLARARKLPMADTFSESAFYGFNAPRMDRLSIGLVSGWGLDALRMRKLARRLARAGHLVSCFSFLSGTHAPRVTYEDGVWLHSGGTWRLDKPMPGKRSFARRARARAEMARVAPHRQFDLVLGNIPDPGLKTVRRPLPGLRRDVSIAVHPGSSVSLEQGVEILRASLIEKPVRVAPGRTATNVATTAPGVRNDAVAG